jgi:enoyl-CoA hydratase/carnithine racemase
MSPSGAVRSTVDGAVATLVIDRPDKLNALTSSMTSQLEAHVTAINADAAVRVVILTGAGRAFCVGSDIDSLREYATPWAFGARRDYGDILRALTKPCIAAINGYAYGGGLEVALACDLRIAAASASFAAPEVKLGWIGGSGQSVYLNNAVGSSNAAWMLFTGDPIDADAALRWGLVSRVYPADELLGAAHDLAATIASRAPIATQTAKVNLRAAESMAIADAITLERHLQTICFATADASEGRAAFADRRPPNFEGR